MTIDKQTSRRIVGIVAISLFTAWGIGHLNGVPKIFSQIFRTLTPILIGALMAFIINLPMSWFEKKFFSKPWKNGEKYRKKLARPISILFAYSMFLLVITLMVTLVVPDLVNTIVSFAQQLPDTFKKLNDLFVEFSQENTEFAKFVSASSFNFNNILNQAINWVYSAGSQIAQAVLGIVQGTVQGIFNFFLGLIFSFYFLVRKEVLFAEIKAIGYSLMPEPVMDKLSQLSYLVSTIFSKFFTGQGIEAVITGLMTFTSMVLLGFSFPLTISVIQVFGTFIPIVGALASSVFGIILILVEDSFLKALLFAVLIIAIQQIEGNFIYPRVMGSQIGLPSFWVFVAVTVGTTMFGFIGALLSVPLTTVIYILLKAWTAQRIKARGVDEEKIYNINSSIKFEDDVKKKTTMTMTAANLVSPLKFRKNVNLSPKRLEHEQEIEHLDLEEKLAKAGKVSEDESEIEYLKTKSREHLNEQSFEKDSLHNQEISLAEKEANSIATYLDEHFDFDSVEHDLKEDIKKSEKFKSTARKHPFLSKKQILDLIDNNEVSDDEDDFFTI